MRNSIQVYEMGFGDYTVQEWPQDIVDSTWQKAGLIALLQNAKDISRHNDASVFVVINNTEIARYRFGDEVSYMIHEDADARISNALNMKGQHNG